MLINICICQGLEYKWFVFLVMGVDILFNVPKHQNPILYTYQLVNVPVRIMYLGAGKLVKVDCDWMQHFARHLQQGWKLIDIFWDQSKKSHGGTSYIHLKIDVR